MKRREYVYVKLWKVHEGVPGVSFHRFRSWAEVQGWALCLLLSGGEQEYRRCTKSEYDNGIMNNPVDPGSECYLRGVGSMITL